MKKTQPVGALSTLITIQDISAYYQDNVLATSAIDTYFPLEQNLKSANWKTIQNASLKGNVLADPLSKKSTVPVSGRNGYKSITGEMATFGKGFEMTADDFEQWENLQLMFAEMQNAENATKLLEFWNNDLANVRSAIENERRYLCYNLLSSACNIGFTAANSPYMQGLANMSYPVSAWQKDAVATSWANPEALILNDIKTYFIDLPRTKNLRFGVIKINADWFEYIRMNTQIQKYCASLVQNMFSTQAPPTLEAINSMMSTYYGAAQAITFEVIDETLTRENADGTTTTSNPFADGVAIASKVSQVGRFQWHKLYTNSPERETFNSFYMVGSYKTETDVAYGKTYGRAEGFPVIDDYAEMMYLKVNAIAWS